jgi:hypothetical protein
MIRERASMLRYTRVVCLVLNLPLLTAHARKSGALPISNYRHDIDIAL